MGGAGGLTPSYSGSGTSMGGTNLQKLAIGAGFSSAGTYHIHGAMCHFTIYKKKLSATEINYLYASGRRPQPITISDLVHYWPMDTESDFPASGNTLSSVSVIKDAALLGGASMDLTVNSGSHINCKQGIPVDSRSQTEFGNALEEKIASTVSNFTASYGGGSNVTITADNVGTAGNVTITSVGTMFSNVGNTTGGTNASGSIHTEEVETWTCWQTTEFCGRHLELQTRYFTIIVIGELAFAGERSTARHRRHFEGCFETFGCYLTKTWQITVPWESREALLRQRPTNGGGP